jgi:3-dehydroquinate synthetase
MVIEATIGELIGITESGTSARIARSLVRFGLPVDLSTPGTGAEALLQATRSDKKARDSTVRYSLVSRVGSANRTDRGAWTHEVPDEVVRTVASAGG